MTKRISAVILSLCLLITMVAVTTVSTVAADTWNGSIATSFAGGSGTEDDPYQIATGAQLAYLATLINGSSNSTYCSCYYVLTADIDLNNISWTPIGYASRFCFKGTFDGDGHTISNLYMSSTSLYGGLFGMVSQATIKNVTLSGCNITGYTYSGGIVGYVQAMSTVIQNCTVSGSVSCVQTSSTSPCIAGGIVGNGNYTSLIGCVNNATVIASGIGKLYAGGLAGSLSNGTISSCCNNGSVAVSYDDAKSEYVGGLVGDLSSKSTVSDSYNTGSVTADLSGVLSDAYAGGLFGQVGTSCTVTECYNAGVVTATATSTVYAGGLAGVSNATGATISNSYNAGTVSGTSESAYIGGLVGYNYSKNTIQNCHNVGTVSGTTSNDVGGIAGKNGGTITNAYYLSTSASTGVGNSVGSGKPVSKTTEEFASGEVAYLLNGSVSGGTPWYQTIGADSYPVFDSTHLLVYVATTCIGTVSSYNNTGDETTHSNLVHYEAVDATCTTDGSEEYWHCSGCDKYYSDADATTEITDTSTLTTAATGHTYVDTVTAPTCTEQGYTTHTCSVCGDNYDDTYVAATGHTYGEPVFTWAEDYSTALAVFTCTSNDDRQTVAATIDSETTEAKCESDGVTVYTATAVFNGLTYTDKKSVVMTATGHTAGTPTIENEVPATCTTDGSFDTVTRCTVCDAIISRVTTTVPATGHTYVDTVTAPTCTEKGYTTYTCSVCGDTYTADETAALGHSYEAVVTAPTCTETGYTTYTCSVCGDTYTADETAALGHSYEFQYFTWSSDLSSATAIFKCKTCGELYTLDATITGEGSLGVSAHIATVTFNGETYTDTQTTGTSLLKTAADYTAVNEAIEKANALNASDYTNFEIVTAAIDAVNWNLSIINQDTVNAYAENIEAAIVNLIPLVEETVTITEPIEDSTTETEPEEIEVTESEPETNPTTGVAVVLLPMAITTFAVIFSKKR